MKLEPFSIEHEFVEKFPKERRERTLYISTSFATAVHNCMCGCGTKIVTPLSPPQWRMTFDGETVSLFPSIGNSGLACRSHYVIKRNRVLWAHSWNDKEIAAGRARDKALRDQHFDIPVVDKPSPVVATKDEVTRTAKSHWFQSLLTWFR